MTTKGSRRRVALERAKAEANERYPEQTSKARSLRIGFVAGVMWHREHPWHENTKPSDPSAKQVGTSPEHANETPESWHVDDILDFKGYRSDPHYDNGGSPA